MEQGRGKAHPTVRARGREEAEPRKRATRRSLGFWRERLRYLEARFASARRNNHALLKPLAHALSLAKRRIAAALSRRGTA